MTEIKCIAVDDEPLALELVCDNIKRIPYLNCVATFNSAIKAAEYLKTNKVDLIFLDIQMPGLTGVELARKLSDIMIIFTTAYDDYAVEGFEVAAIDYVLKPIMFSRFEKACNKAKEFYDLKNKADKTEQSIIVRSEHRTIRLLLNNIIYIEGLKDYVKIFISGSEKPLLTRTNLKGINDQLPAKIFKRVHKSYVVNFTKVTGFGTDKLLLDKLEIPLGVSYRAEIKEVYKSGTSGQ